MHCNHVKVSLSLSLYLYLQAQCMREKSKSYSSRFPFFFFSCLLTAHTEMIINEATALTNPQTKFNHNFSGFPTHSLVSTISTIKAALYVKYNPFYKLSF